MRNYPRVTAFGSHGGVNTVDCLCCCVVAKVSKLNTWTALQSPVAKEIHDSDSYHVFHYSSFRRDKYMFFKLIVENCSVK